MLSQCATAYGPMVKRSRHRPFTAVTRVRFPMGSSQIYREKVLTNPDKFVNIYRHGDIAKW